MKLFKLIKIGIVTLLISLFFGFTIFVAAIGGFVPSIYKISSPIVCKGNVEIESKSYSYKPGQVGVTHKIYCERRGRNFREDITFPAILVSGFIYSLILFPFIFLGGYSISGSKKFEDIKRRNRRVVLREPQIIDFTNQNTTQRLTELKNLREQGLITEEEFQVKRAEILRKL